MKSKRHFVYKKNCKQYINILKFSRSGHQASRICASLLQKKKLLFTHYSIPSAETNILPITLSSATSRIQLYQTPTFQRGLLPLARPTTLYFSVHSTTLSCSTLNVTDTYISSLSLASRLTPINASEYISSSVVLLYPAFLVILLVSGISGRMETTEKIAKSKL